MKKSRQELRMEREIRHRFLLRKPTVAEMQDPATVAELMCLVHDGLVPAPFIGTVTGRCYVLTFPREATLSDAEATAQFERAAEQERAALEGGHERLH